jgi:hypothetical protein
MSLSRRLVYSRYFCETCQKETEFLPIRLTLSVTGIPRRTLYNWMERQWIHWLQLPNGRRLVCQNSLSQQGRSGLFATFPQKNCAKVSKSVPKCDIQ